jgi:hypothetical protein
LAHLLVSMRRCISARISSSVQCLFIPRSRDRCSLTPQIPTIAKDVYCVTRPMEASPRLRGSTS